MRLSILTLAVLFPFVLLSQAKTQLESTTSEQPLEVLHDGNTILKLNSNAGLILGSNLSAPAGGLRIVNLEGVDGPLRADADGNIYKGSTGGGPEVMSIHPDCFNGDYLGNPNGVRVGAGQPFIYCPISFPHGVTIKKFKFCYQDLVSDGNVQVALTRNTYNAGVGVRLEDIESTGSSGLGCKEINNLNIVVDNNNYNYHLSLWGTGLPLVDTYVVTGVVIEYEY